MNDLIRIAEIRNQSEIRNALALLGDSLFNQAVNTPDVLNALAEKYFSKAKVLTISYDKKLAGLCAYYDNEATAFISMLVINKDQQRHGFGTILLKEVLHRCRERKISIVKLEVSPNNNHAIRFYTKNGFALHHADKERIILVIDVFLLQ